MNSDRNFVIAFVQRSKPTLLRAGVLLALAIAGMPVNARAVGGTPFIGEISCGGWNFCPNGWAECAGQLVSIAENEALFNLIGTTYGGDGQESFALPNLSGRTMLGVGQSSGTSSRVLGEAGGVESVTLTINQTPNHAHALQAQAATGDAATPVNRVPAGVAASDNRYAPAANSFMANGAVGYAGSSQPHNNLQPYQTLKCCISLFGIFPTMN